MEEKRPVYIVRIILAFIIATLIFSAGFLLCYMVTYSKYQSISISQEKIRYELMNLDIQRELVTSSCESFSPYTLSSELDNMGSMMGILEQRFGKNDNNVLEQKKIYTLLEIEHFLLVRDYDLKCNKTLPVILFFYSNKDNFKDDGEKIGYILSSIKNEKDSKVLIYSFDYDLDFELIKMLKQKYNITQENMILINEKIKLNNVKNIDDINKYIN